VAVAKVFSSPWCRCVDTTQLLEVVRRRSALAHGVNIAALTGVNPTQGDIVIVKVDLSSRGGELETVTQAENTAA
jgi:hypothetical protein